MADTNGVVEPAAGVVAPAGAQGPSGVVVPAGVEAPAAVVSPAATPAVVEPAPADYSKLKLDDKALSNAGMTERVSAFAKENSLSAEQAQVLLASISNEVKAYTEAKNTEWQTMTDTWVADVRADKELGGLQFDQVMATAKKVVHRFATPELVQQLGETGFGNHPELVRLFYRIGQTMKEDALILPGANASESQRDMTAILYDHPSSITSN